MGCRLLIVHLWRSPLCTCIPLAMPVSNSQGLWIGVSREFLIKSLVSGLFDVELAVATNLEVDLATIKR